MAQPFNARKLSTTGIPVPIASPVAFVNDGLTSRGEFSVSQNGILAYISGGLISNSNDSNVVQLTWFDRTGKVLGTAGTPGIQSRGAISPDGRTVAVVRKDSQSFFDVWINDLARGTASRFTFGTGNKLFPVWSPDGGHIAFRSSGFQRANANLYQKATNGAAEDEELVKDAPSMRPDDWSRDGRYIIGETLAVSKSGTDVWVLPLFGDRKPFPYLHTDFNEHDARLSPNGQWLALS